MTRQPYLSLALLGECLVQHSGLAVKQDEAFLRAVDVVRESDGAIADLEVSIQDGEDAPAYTAAGSVSGTFLIAPPGIVNDMRWLGLKAVFTAHNHANDFGEGGILTTLKHLDAGGLAHAGSGPSLTAASAPTYFETSKGRVAVIGASDWGPRDIDAPYSIPQSAMAADQGPMFKSRPGINLLRYEVIHHVDRSSLDALRRISQSSGWDDIKNVRRMGGNRHSAPVGQTLFGGERDTESAFHFMTSKFVLDDKFSFETVAFQEDLDRNYRWIREARRHADIVVVGLHQHGPARGYIAPEERVPDEPADHTRAFARGAIDAGADVFVRHGTVKAGGIEIYQGKPIIYGLSGFIVQPDHTRHVPDETRRRWNLDENATSADWLELRVRNETAANSAGLPRERRRGVAAIYKAIFNEDLRLAEIHVIPIEVPVIQGSRARSGLPRLVERNSDQSRKILEVIARRCSLMGSSLEIVDGIGVVRIPER
jgi:poly-gamma-glutamate capsule biosynthesis protein CapA/YwtB (metallophosphatase superfamily)